MAQKKLGVAVEPPDLPADRVLYAADDLPSEFVITGATPQFIASKERTDKALIRIECIVYPTLEKAKKAEEAALGQTEPKRSEVYRSGRTVTRLLAAGDDVRGYEKLASTIRQRMGFPEHSFDTVLPIPSELPVGFSLETSRTDAAAIVTDLGLETKPGDIKRAWQAKLKPQGSIVLFEVADYNARRRVEDQVKRRGAAETGHDLVFGVEGPDDETLDALENRMREKFGGDPRSPRAILIGRLQLQPSDLPAGWTLENAVSNPRLYSAELKGPDGTLKLTARESHNYGEIEKFRKEFAYAPGDLVLFNYAVILHVGGATEALWPAIDQIEVMLRKKMSMPLPRLEDFPLATRSGDSGHVLLDKVYRERVELKKVADRFGIEVARIKGALVKSPDGRTLLELADGADAAPKAGLIIRRGKFVACLDAKDPEAEAVRAQLRAPRP